MEKETSRLEIRLTPSLKKQLTNLAGREGKKLSQIIKDLLFEWVERRKDS